MASLHVIRSFREKLRGRFRVAFERARPKIDARIQKSPRETPLDREIKHMVERAAAVAAAAAAGGLKLLSHGERKGRGKNEIQGRMTESNEMMSAEQRHNLLWFLFPMILPGSPTCMG